jgi:signal transduction histidine kinase
MDQEWISAADLARLRARLHDTVLQTLEFIASGGMVGAGADSEQLMRLAAREATDLRQLLEGLLSPEAEHLVRAIEGVVEHERCFAAQDIEVIAERCDGSVRGMVCVELASAVREALTNARKHSGGECVRVEIEEEGGSALVTVADDGAGADPKALTSRLGIKHSIFGRMARLGGVAKIDTAPGAGMTVTLAIGAGAVAKIAPAA